MLKILSLLLSAALYLPEAADTGNRVPDQAGDRHGELRGVISGTVYSGTVKFSAPAARSLRFDSRQVLQVPGAGLDTPSLTVEGFFKPAAAPAQFARLFTKGDSIGGDRGSFRLYTKSGVSPDVDRVIFAVNLDGKAYELGSPIDFDVFPARDGVFDWVHLAGIFDEKTGRGSIFVNGELKAEAVLKKSPIRSTDADFTVGNRAEADRGFNGWIDEVRLTPAALKREELGFDRSWRGRAGTAEKFEWEDSRCGVTDAVPAPWQALRVEQSAGRTTVLAAGKEFIFAGSVLPEQVAYGELELLGAPVQLEFDGAVAAGVPGTLAVECRTPRMVALTGELAAGRQRFSGRIEIEFDGLCRLSVAPVLDRPRPPVQSLRLRLPLKPELGQLAKVGGRAGALTEKLAKSWAFPLWVGGEQGGFTLFSESNQFWVNPKPTDAFTVAPLPGATEAAANFITAATVFKPDSQFVLYFQPTPIRPFPDVRPELGFFHGGFLDMEKTPGTVNLQYPGNGLLRPAGTLDVVLTPDFDPAARPDPLIGREPYIREVFSIVTAGEERFRLCWSIPHGGIIADEGIRPSGETIWDGTRQTLFTGSLAGVKGRKYRLTLCWGDGRLRCFLDGRLLAECRRDTPAGPGDPELDGAVALRFGESLFNFLTPRFGSGFRLHAVRLLDRLELPQADEPPAVVPGTLLYDDFSTGKPAVGPAGTLSAGGVRAPGEVSLYQAPDRIVASCLDRVRDCGSTALIYHQSWSKIQSHYLPEDPEKLRNLIAACHAKSLKILLYFGFELSEKAPEFKLWHRRALRLHPERPTPELPQVRRDQKSGKVCYGGVWQDFITFAIDKSLKDFGFDGVYLDAAMVPYPCPNELHGCGYRDGAGKLQATHPVYGYLTMLRRIHNIVKSRGGLLTGNQATGPLWGYPDSVWVGEGYKYRELATDPLKAIPLDEWRTHFSGRNYGTPGELLLYEYPPHWRRDTGQALAGLHGMALRPEIWWKGSYLEKVALLRAALKSFGWEQAEFIPYYRENHQVKCGNPQLRISCYSSPRGRLLWIANLSAEPQEALVAADGTGAHDPVLNCRLPISGGQLKVKVAPYNWRLVQIDR